MIDFAAKLEQAAAPDSKDRLAQSRRLQRQANRAAANLVLLSYCGEQIEYVGRGSVELSERLWIRILTKLARRGVRPEAAEVDALADRELKQAVARNGDSDSGD